VTPDAGPLSATLLTPAGVGAMAVIRVCGARVREILPKVFTPKQGRAISDYDTGRLQYGTFKDGEEVIDDGIVAIRSDAAPGFVADLTVHGGVRIVERLFSALVALGAAIVEESRTPHSLRAVVEDEACRMLGLAKTRRAVRLIARQRTALPHELNRISALTNEEAYEALATLRDRSLRALFVTEGAKVVFFGPPNAGKSTLINRLFDRSANLVSDQAGTTRDWVSVDVALDGVPLRVIDTAGVRESADGIEREAVTRGLDHLHSADVQVLVVDGTIDRSRELIDRYGSAVEADRLIVAVNKCDLSVVKRSFEFGVASSRMFDVSGLVGTGCSALSDALSSVLSIDGPADEPLLFSSRLHGWISNILSDEAHNSVAGALLDHIPHAVWCGNQPMTGL
jgi:tRNA modification GTPase